MRHRVCSRQSIVRLLMVSLCLLLWRATARAQEDDSKNAATWYERAFDQLDRFTPEEMELITSYGADAVTPPSPEVRSLLTRAAPIIDSVMRASNQGYSDFGLNYSDGFDMLLPHLGQMRNIARIIRADSALHLSDGDGAGAAGRIAALYRIADHAGDDHVLISSLVSRAVFEVADTAAQAGFDRGAFDPISAAALLKATTAYDQRDPFQALDAMMMEQTICVETIREHFSDPQKRSEILTELTGEAGLADEFAGMTQEDIDTSLQQYTDMMGEYVQAFAQEDPQVAKAQLDAITQRLENHEYGPIAQILTPAFGRVYDVSMQGRDKLHARIALLEEITKGEVDVQSLTNAAVWYRRGIASIESLDTPWKEALASLDAGRALSAEQIAALDASADAARVALGLFVDGSNMRRCDFATERDAARERFIPKYAPGMRDAFRLLALESLRLAAGGDSAGAAHLLAAAFRVAAHLSDDDLFISALVARDGFIITSQAAAGIEERQHFDDDQRRELAGAIRRCGASDPFGFIGSGMKAREHLAGRIDRWGDPVGVESRRKRIAAWLDSLDADALLYLLAMEDVIDSNLEPRAAFNRAGAEALHEYLLPETMDLAGIDAPSFAALISEGRADSFEFPETIHLAAVSSRMSSARSDQWATIAWARQWARQDGEPDGTEADAQP